MDLPGLTHSPQQSCREILNTSDGPIEGKQNALCQLLEAVDPIAEQDPSKFPKQYKNPGQKNSENRQKIITVFTGSSTSHKGQAYELECLSLAGSEVCCGREYHPIKAQKTNHLYQECLRGSVCPRPVLVNTKDDSQVLCSCSRSDSLNVSQNITFVVFGRVGKRGDKFNYCPRNAFTRYKNPAVREIDFSPLAKPSSSTFRACKHR